MGKGLGPEGPSEVGDGRQQLLSNGSLPDETHTHTTLSVMQEGQRPQDTRVSARGSAACILGSCHPGKPFSPHQGGHR